MKSFVLLMFGIIWVSLCWSGSLSGCGHCGCDVGSFLRSLCSSLLKTARGFCAGQFQGLLRVFVYREFGVYVWSSAGVFGDSLKPLRWSILRSAKCLCASHIGGLPWVSVLV